MNKEQESKRPSWVTTDWDAECDDANRAWWDKHYGKGNWRLIWQLPNNEILEFDRLFTLFTDSYVNFFEENPVDALFLTNHFSYVYYHDYITKKEAFNPHALYNQSVKADQFHHVAINLALVNVLGLEFKGSEPVGRDEARFWTPDKIPPHPKYIPPHPLYPNLNEFYKKSNKLQIKK